MPTTTYGVGEERPPGVDPVSPEADRPDAPQQNVTDAKDVDTGWWERALSDAERAEKPWRARGRDIVQIYRGDIPITRPRASKYASASSYSTQQTSASVFNILYANTEVMLPAAYSKPPDPVVRSRFVKKTARPIAPPSPPMMGPPGMGPPGLGPMGPPPPGAGPPGAPGMPLGPPPPGMAAAGPSAPPTLPPGGPTPGPPRPPMPPPASSSPDGMGGGLGGPPPSPMSPPTPGGGPPLSPEPGPPPGLGPSLPAATPAGLPEQNDIETAAAVMEKALEIVVADEASNEAVKSAVRDMLLPGRGVCRVRWKPIINQVPVDDPVMGGQLSHPVTGEPQTKEVKIWETVDDEYVFWEDLLVDPVRQHSDVSWLAFRHLFDQQSLLQEFAESPQLKQLQAANRLSDLFKWTEETAAKSPIGGGQAPKAASRLDAVIKKAMVWEIWNRSTKEIIWLIRENGGTVLRIDPDALGLEGFYPIPKPIYAVVSTDTMIPKAFYDLYAQLAADLDDTSRRISDLTAKIKVRGGYNAANKDIASLLTADDGKLLPVDGVDLMSGGLQNHIWLVPILEWVNALKVLYDSRNQQKQAIYEIIGLSDIVRGASNPYETATAQRIKGTMGTGRMQGVKQSVANFVRDLMKMKADIIAQNFDAETLTKMTGEDVTPQVLAILRSDFARVCSIDIETDSTVEYDETTEKESNAQTMQVIGATMSAAQGMLTTGLLPPPMVIQLTLEMTKMMLHPVRHSRGVIDLINGYQEMLTNFMKMDPMGASMRPPPPPPGQGPQGPIPPRGANGQHPPQAPQPGQGMPPGGPSRPGPPPQAVTRPSSP
jgi:hypothetical protein